MTPKFNALKYIRARAFFARLSSNFYARVALFFLSFFFFSLFFVSVLLFILANDLAKNGAALLLPGQFFFLPWSDRCSECTSSAYITSSCTASAMWIFSSIHRWYWTWCMCVSARDRPFARESVCIHFVQYAMWCAIRCSKSHWPMGFFWVFRAVHLTFFKLSPMLWRVTFLHTHKHKRESITLTFSPNFNWMQLKTNNLYSLCGQI